MQAVFMTINSLYTHANVMMDFTEMDLFVRRNERVKLIPTCVMKMQDVLLIMIELMFVNVNPVSTNQNINFSANNYYKNVCNYQVTLEMGQFAD